MPNVLLDAAGRRRSPATMPDFHSGRPPRNKAVAIPPHPPTVEEIIAVMRQAGTTPHGLRMRGLIVVLWRAGLRIHEALGSQRLTSTPAAAQCSSATARAAAAAKSAWTTGPGNNSAQWLTVRVQRPVGPLFCILTGPTRGRAWTQAAAREQLRHTAARRRPATIRATPTPPRPRRRDGPRRRPAHRHPTPARPHQPRHHLDLPPGHRQRRDHRHRPRPPGTGGAGQHHAAAVTAPAAGRRPSR
jgi:hypothetical protein